MSEDFISLDEARRLHGNARPSARTRLDVVDPLKLHGKAIPERKWLVDGLIPQGAVTMLGGDGGVGKSLLAQQLITAASTGKHWLGKQTMSCKTLGIFCEDDPDEIHRRQADINRHYGLEFADLESMAWASRVGQDNILADHPQFESISPTGFYASILNHALDTGAQLVVLDSLHDLYSGNENFRGQVRQFVNILTEIAREINGAVVLTAHPSLSGLSSGSGLSGSTAWNNACRSRLYLTHAKDTDDFADADERILKTKKANYAGLDSEIRVRWVDGVFVHEKPLTGVVGSIARENAEKVFMRCLETLLQQGHEPSFKIEARTNYAPKLMMSYADARGYPCDVLGRAMRDLVAREEVVFMDTDGPPSRRKQILVPRGYGQGTNTTGQNAK